MKKITLIIAVIFFISCTKHESTTGKTEWFSYDFEALSTTSPKQIATDELNIESYYRGVYADRVQQNIEQQRDITFKWSNRGLTYTITAYLSGGKSNSNERRTDPQQPPKPPPPKFGR